MNAREPHMLSAHGDSADLQPRHRKGSWRRLRVGEVAERPQGRGVAAKGRNQRVEEPGDWLGGSELAVGKGEKPRGADEAMRRVSKVIALGGPSVRGTFM